ncbi:rap/ran GTPase-activating protein [Pelomyxa schiedti]|nr:rap/ran GTPase-activating protein [Pelomyxa schiedti]
MLMPTQAHVFWVMECLGQGFRLPLSDHPLINQCVDLYSRWIQGNPDKLPVWVRSNLETFYLLCLKHMTLLFNNRTKVKEDVQIHKNLCMRVLQVFSIVCKQQLKPETWEVILKLILGVTDSFLCPSNYDEASCSPLLAERLMQILYEAYLLSCTTNIHLWGNFLKLQKTWTNLVPVVSQWTATSVALTVSVLERLYTSSTNKSVLISTNASTSSVIEMSDDYVYYAWQRVLNSLGNVGNIPSPGNYKMAISGICDCIESFLEHTRNQEHGAPDGNTILNLFGGPLFESMITNKVAFEEGVAIAISGLCKIFTQCRNCLFSPKYMAAFICVLKLALTTIDDKNMALVSTLIDSQALLTYQFNGYRMLVPYYLIAISRILKQVQDFSSSITYPFSRHIALRVQLQYLSKLYQSTTFPEYAAKPTSGGLDINTYYDIEPIIGDILITALDNEVNMQNLISLLSSSIIFLNEFLPSVTHNTQFSGPQTAPLFVWSFMQLVLCSITTSKWVPDVCCFALNMVSELISKYRFLEKNDQFAHTVVSQLCVFVRNCFEKEDCPEQLVVDCYRTICHWLMADDAKWVFQNLASLSSVVKIAISGIPALSKETNRRKETPAILEAAIATLLLCSNQLAAFPSIAGAERISALVNEELLLTRICETMPTLVSAKEAPQLIRYYMMDDNIILSVIDLPSTPSKGELVSIVIVRDRTGKYVWKGHLRYVTQANTPCAPIEPVVGVEGFRPLISSWKIQSADVVGATVTQQVNTFLEQINSRDEPLPLSDFIAEETTALERRSYGLSIVVPPEMPPPCEYLYPQYRSGRVFSTHMGFSQVPQVVIPLDHTPQFLSALKQLDQQPERECAKVGVIYAKTGQSMEEEIYSNSTENLSSAPPSSPAVRMKSVERYQRFVSSLGWEISVATHTGFLGGLDRKLSTGTTAPYFATFNSEIIFHVSTRMNNISAKKRLIGKDFVLVVWTEDGNYDPKTLESQYHDVKIIITPLENGLYHCTTLTNPKLGNVGPLVDQTTVSEWCLGALVRMTALNGHHAAQVLYEGFCKPFVLRQRLLSDITRRYKKADMHRNTFFSSLFFDAGLGTPPPTVKTVVPGLTNQVVVKHHASPVVSLVISQNPPGTQAPSSSKLSESVSEIPIPAPEPSPPSTSPIPTPEAPIPPPEPQTPIPSPASEIPPPEPSIPPPISAPSIGLPHAPPPPAPPPPVDSYYDDPYAIPPPELTPPPPSAPPAAIPGPTARPPSPSPIVRAPPPSRVLQPGQALPPVQRIPPPRTAQLPPLHTLPPPSATNPPHVASPPPSPTPSHPPARPAPPSRPASSPPSGAVW